MIGAARRESIGVTVRWLLVETSGRTGEVAIAEDDRFIASARLDSGRQHARDLIPAVATLFDRAGWSPADVSSVAVSIGPGSYTGLRIGVMTAKALAYATGCELISIPTFHVIAHQAEIAGDSLEVIADGLKGKLYAQPFSRQSPSNEWRPAGKLAIVTEVDWRASLSANTLVTGPGVGTVGNLPNVIPESQREPRVATLLALAATGRYACADVFGLEPLYLRPSSAEEQWDARSLGL